MLLLDMHICEAHLTFLLNLFTKRNNQIITTTHNAPTLQKSDRNTNLKSSFKTVERPRTVHDEKKSRNKSNTTGKHRFLTATQRHYDFHQPASFTQQPTPTQNE